ncbi:outer membrane protein assembly factor BamB family protein [Methanococcoides methylutens]|uniref:outer membrane protein assembly factor BamB family protein n=1 Tax=Methanococcoides methylutens TaxID=2226 RepID=UPI0006936DB2|nr:PQQ-binding-like beta-propeller repeat protein [Methanococcoides methylutens]
MVKLQRKQTGKKLTPGRWSVKASITILLLLFCLGTGMAAAQEIYFEPGDTTLAGVGQTEALNFYLDQLPAGLSGYNLTLGISDPSVARITGVEFPDWSGTLHTNSQLPANSICIKAIDLNKNVNAGDANILLGTVTVESLAIGEGNITVSINRLEDDNGNTFPVDIREAKMSVMDTVVEPNGIRSIEPNSIEPENAFTVTVVLSAGDTDVESILLEEKLPDGWTVTPVRNDGMSYSITGDLHTWHETSNILESGSSKTIVYDVTVPAETSGGIYNIDGWFSAYEANKFPLVYHHNEVSGENTVEVIGEQIFTSTDWPLIGKGLYNNAVTSDRAPIQEPNDSGSWSTMTQGAGFSGIDVHPLVVGDLVYVTTPSSVFAVDRNTGEIEWQNDIIEGATAPLGTPAYGNGKLFVTAFSKLYAYDAISGNELLNVTIDSENQEFTQMNTPVMYEDGRIFFGEWIPYGEYNRKYYCYNEDGTLEWTYVTPTGKGYYWAGSAVVGRYLVFGDDALHLTSLDKYDGEVVDEINVSELLEIGYNGEREEIRNSITYSPDTGRIYSASEAGYCFSIGFNVDGTFNTADAQKSYIGKSTCTPTIYNGRVYVGTGTHTGTGDVYCLNEEDLSEIWKYTPNGGVQGSPVISTAYDDGDGEVYIYFTTNVLDARVYCLKDYTGNTVPELQWYYEAPPEKNEYTLHGVTIKDGRIFYGNDRGYLFGLSDVGNNIVTPPEANFSSDLVSGYAPQTVQFTDLSTDAAGWSWDFDNDGIEDSIEQNPQFTYTAPGTYTVSLTVNNAAGSDTETKIDYIAVNDWNPWNDPDSEGLPDGTYITLTEVIDAYNCFRYETPVPESGTNIDFTTVIDMYNAFRYGNPM